MVIIEEHFGVKVLRDDLLPGGTKSVLMPHIIGEAKEYVYASPVYGGFQIALAIYCKKVGKTATIFCAERKMKHPNTLRCIEEGANVIEIKHGYLSVIEKYARIHCEMYNAIKLEFGAKNQLNTAILMNRVNEVVNFLNGEPDEIYCAVGSGLLIESIAQATQRSIIHGVVVGKGYNWPQNDYMRKFENRVKLYNYPKKFDKEATVKPPFPSMPNYDAKAWEHCISNGKSKNVLFWNVL